MDTTGCRDLNIIIAANRYSGVSAEQGPSDWKYSVPGRASGRALEE